MIPPKEVRAAFELLLPVQKERVVVERCQISIEEIFNERKELEKVLKDSNTMVGALRRTLMVLFLVGGIIMELALFQVDIGQWWTSLTAFLISAAFVFGETVKVSEPMAGNGRLSWGPGCAGAGPTIIQIIYKYIYNVYIR